MSNEPLSDGAVYFDELPITYFLDPTKASCAVM